MSQFSSIHSGSNEGFLNGFHQLDYLLHIEFHSIFNSIQFTIHTKEKFKANKHRCVAVGRYCIE